MCAGVGGEGRSRRRTQLGERPTAQEAREAGDEVQADGERQEPTDQGKKSMLARNVTIPSPSVQDLLFQSHVKCTYT